MNEWVYYLVPAAVVLATTRMHRGAFKKQTKEANQAFAKAKEEGMTEPPTLHPVVDLNKCMGSGACAKVCPEDAIGVIQGKAVLIGGAHCIGHGACNPACPVGAIRLVFGTAKRGMEIPNVDPMFQTNVDGIYIAGELGGMGLIRNAVEQGRQAIQNITKSRPKGANEYDLVIVGAGPAGLSASLSSQEQKLKYVTLEQEDAAGGTTYHYPRRKLVMTAPMKMPVYGEIKVREVSKEGLMEIWGKVIKQTKPNIRYNEQMTNIEKGENGGYVITTNRGSYKTTSILLCIGRRGTPRKLGAKGEDSSKVVYRLIEAEQYANLHVLVVGGGDSALEAALDLSDQPGTTVTLSYRSNAFSRVKPKNRSRIEESITSGRINVILESTVELITEKEVTLKIGDTKKTMPNDGIIVCVGGELPTPFLKKIGIQVEMHYGE